MIQIQNVPVLNFYALMTFKNRKGLLGQHEMVVKRGRELAINCEKFVVLLPFCLVVCRKVDDRHFL